MKLRDIYRARRRIRSIAKQTPLLRSPWLTDRMGATVHLKLETVQETGSFKVRGAANKLLSLPADQQARGVITFSTGNHGLAVAYVAQQAGVHAVVCVSERVPKDRVAALERLEAKVIVHGDSQDEAGARAEQIQQERGLTMIPPFDDPFIIAGQGTIGLELLEECPAIDTALVPLSGGGLITGIGLTLKSADPAIRVIGLSMARAPVMYHSLQAGRPIEMAEADTLANSLQGGIGLDNRYTFRMVREYVDDVVLLTEDEIADGMVFALEKHHLVVEGAGAVGLGALLHDKVENAGDHVAVVVSGGNVDASLLIETVRQRGTRDGNHDFD